MASLNKVMLIGNLGRDPEVRSTANGKKIANLTLATTDSRTDRSTGERKDTTEWHRLVIFDKQAEIAEKYLTKGKQVYVEGRIQSRKWTDKENQERVQVEILVDSFVMLGANDAAPQKTKPAAISADAPFDDEIPF